MSARAANPRDPHRIRLLHGGQEFFPALVVAMDRARSEVRLETYIFDFTGDAAQVAEALIRAASRGVTTWVVVDGVGTPDLPQPWCDRFKAAGVQWKVFSPLGTLGLLIPSRWRRLHRKLCVIDGRLAFCGGINILDDHHDPHHGRLARPRLDFAVRAAGALVMQAQEATAQLWWRMQSVEDMRAHHFPHAFSTLRTGGLTLPWRLGDDAAADDALGHRVQRATLVLRDNLLHRGRIERAYRRAIAGATQEIIIANAYFLPGRRLRKALIHAARRGVTVRLLLQGRYEYFMQFHAARPIYGALLAAGVEIHEYTASFLHAKVAVIDAATRQSWATVGSSNLDPLSLLLAREANVVVRDTAFAQDLRARLVDAMAQGSQQVAVEDYAHRPLLQRVKERIALGLMRLALFLTGMRY
jgi:cardiolipin synthase